MELFSEALLVPLFGIIGVFGMPVFIVWIVHHYKGKGEQAFHDTLQELIKSGQELSPDVIAGMPGYRGSGSGKENKEINDIRTGLITFGTGAGLAVFGYVIDSVLIGIGLLVLFIGLGILAYGLYAKNKLADDDG
jgi:hypothetical protein|tara:strand:- start:3972 stop:4376 length:405 start_codon:yes stop_codon:yes gene_type:complete